MTQPGATPTEPQTPAEGLLAACHDAYYAWSHYFDADVRTDYWTPLCESMDRLREAMRAAEGADVDRAYTLLCSVEPALIRSVQQSPTPEVRRLNQLLLDESRKWVMQYRYPASRPSESEHPR